LFVVLSDPQVQIGLKSLQGPETLLLEGDLKGVWRFEEACLGVEPPPAGWRRSLQSPGIVQARLVELLKHGRVEALAEAVSLQALGLGLGVADVLDGQVGLVLMVFPVAAILRATIRGE
jgi:hypothetical protein